MAYDKVIDSAWLEAGLKKIGDGIRSKTGGTAKLAFPDEMDLQIRSIDTQEDLTSELSEQDSLIAQITAALKGKAAGGGGTEEEWIGDGNTHIWITLREGRTSPVLGVCPNGTVTVDWGDGTTPDTLTGTSVTTVQWTPTHNYDSAGDYVITLMVDGEMGFIGNSGTNQGSCILRHSSSGSTLNYAYLTAVQRLEAGDGVTSIGNYAFQRCFALSSIYIPYGTTSIGTYAFNNCYSLASVDIPDSVTSIGTYAFNGCYSLASVDIPDSVTSIGARAFQNCYSLFSIYIPDGVTAIDNSAFYYCYSLSRIRIPDSVTSIGTYAFSFCSSLSNINIPSVTNIGSNAFQNCYSLRNIDIPDCLTSIGAYAFQGCQSLTNIGHIPSGATSIGSYMFQNCYSLVGINIPSSVTSIGTYAFNNCYSVVKLRFDATVPPTVLNSNVFTGLSTDCIISVPVGTLAAYTSATNYPDPATYTYIEED